MPENLLTSALVVALFAWLRSDIRKLHEHLDAFAKGVNDPAELPAALARALDVVRRERRQALLDVIAR